jgi:hypothetical protein
MSKEDRIRRLLPLFEQGRIYLPPTRFRTLYDKSTVNLIDAFVEEEYVAFPVGQHDDMLDCLARIEDPQTRLRWPEAQNYHSRHSDRPTSYLADRGERMRMRGANRIKLTHERPNR